MKFVLVFSLKKKLSKIKISKIRTLLSEKELAMNGHSDHIIEVLITDDHRRAVSYNEKSDTLAILIIDVSTRVDFGVIASYPDEIEQNLKLALDRIHVVW